MLLATLCVVLLSLCAGDQFPSTQRMTSLAVTERTFVSILSDPQDSLQPIEEEANRYLKEYNEALVRLQEATGSDNYVSGLVENPIQAFRMLRRLVMNVRPMLDKLPEGHELRTVFVQEGDLPTLTDDLRPAAHALFNLQVVYGLTAEHVIHGDLGPGVNAGTDLSVEDSVLVADIAAQSGLYSRAVEWNHAVLNRARYDREARKDIKLYAAQKRLDNVTRTHDDKFTEQSQESPESVPEFPEGTFFPSLLSEKPVEEQLPLRDSPAPVRSGKERRAERRFRALCRGESLMRAKKQRSLYCHYRSNQAEFRLQPIRTEIKSTSPLIVVFYDSINAEEIERLNQTLYKILTDRPDAEIKDSDLEGVWNSATNSLHRARSATEEFVSSLTSDGWELLTFGIEGANSAHTGGTEKIQATRENSSACLTYVLNDVDLGGATAFIKAGVQVQPQKGSIVLWKNVDKNGRLQSNMKLRECPILLGSKLIANNWFH